MLYQRMMKEKQKVEDRINDLQSQIDVLPSGTFFCTRKRTDKKLAAYVILAVSIIPIRVKQNTFPKVNENLRNNW